RFARPTCPWTGIPSSGWPPAAAAAASTPWACPCSLPRPPTAWNGPSCMPYRRQSLPTITPPGAVSWAVKEPHGFNPATALGPRQPVEFRSLSMPNLAFALRLVAMAWIIQVINMMLGYGLNFFVIGPGDPYGPVGVFTAPFLSAGWVHLIANSMTSPVLMPMICLLRRPGVPYVLVGLFTAPVLHAGWDHLIANSMTAVVLITMICWSGRRVFWRSSLIILLASGAGTWLIGGAGTVHVGASGMIYGWVAFLITRGLFTKKLSQLAGGVVVLLLYGSLWTGILPTEEAITWRGCLGGALAGILAAWLRPKMPAGTRAVRTAGRASLGM